MSRRRHAGITKTGRLTGYGVLVSVLAAAGIVLLPPTSAFAAGGTFTVTTTADVSVRTGACGNAGVTSASSPLSLREATCLANNVGGAVTINVPAGLYQLFNGELQPGVNPGQTVTINGAGSASTIIDGRGSTRVLDFDRDLKGGVNASINGLTVTNGADSTFGGAGIIAGSGSAATADVMTMNDVVVSNNHANESDQNVTNKPGGGMQFIGGRLTVTNSVFSGNSSRTSPGGGLFYSGQGSSPNQGLSVDGTTFSGNSMSNSNTFSANVGNGGALAVQGTGRTYTVTNSRFVNNVVSATTGPARGAAILANSGTLEVSESTFTGNSVSGGTTNASTGGGVYLASTNVVGTLRYNRFVGNSAPTGSAIGSISTNANAPSNWFGCNAGPGAAGCDTVSGAVTTSPRLQLSATANPNTVTGPNGTSTISALFTRDSAGAAVSGSDLSAFNGASATFSDPPGDATVSTSPGAKQVTLGSDTGRATIDYHSGTVAGLTGLTVRVDNETVSVPLTVLQAPMITSANVATFRTGQFSTFKVTTSGYPTPTITRAGSLPAGLNFVDNRNGTATISGTPTGSGGSFRQELTANNGVDPSATQELTISVGQAPSFTSASTATFRIGQYGSFAITTDANPTVTSIARSGALPAGLNFVDNRDGTAVIAGAPTGSGGSYSLNLTATNGVTPDATQGLAVQVNETPTVTSDPVDQTVLPGTSVSFAAAASGVPTPTVRWQVSSDGGTSFTSVPGATSTTYTITAGPGDDGNRYRAVFTNAAGSATTAAAVLHVGTAPAFTNVDHATFVEGRAGSIDVTTSGMPRATLGQDGSQFPSWLTLTDNNDGSGTLTGTPPAGSGRRYQFTLTAANGVSPSASQIFTLDVDAPPTITSDDHVTFDVGQDTAFTVTTEPGFPTTSTIAGSGSLPSGVELTDNGDGTATLAGRAAVGTGGTYHVRITASASGGQAAPTVQDFTLTVNEPPRITSPDHATFSVGTPGSFTIRTAPGNPTSTSIDANGTLPAGLALTVNGDGTAIIDGTPNAGTGGEYTLTLTASNGVGDGDFQPFTLTVTQPPTITSDDHAAFIRGTSSVFTVTTAVGQPARTTITRTGSLPDGVSFADQGDGTAQLTGIPTEQGTFPLSFTASNGVSPDATQDFTLTVNAPPAVTSDDHATFTVGQAGSFIVTTDAGTPAATTLTRTGALPGGIRFVDNRDGTATLSGTPAAGSGGSYPLQITAANGVGAGVTQPFTLTVNAPPAITSAGATTFTQGVSGTFTVKTRGGFPAGPITLSRSGTLPAGVTFVDNGDGTATLAGAATVRGTFKSTITASNGVAPDASQSFTLTVQQGRVVPLPPTLPPGSGKLTGVPASAKVGQKVRVIGSGFAAGAPVTIGLYPSRTVLARAYANVNGLLVYTVTVPRQLGNQTFVAAGIGPRNEARYLQARTVVTEAP